jgi:hypothetical protein
MVKRTRRSIRKAPAGGIIERRPLFITTVYVLGVLGALVLISSALFTAGGYFSSDDIAVDVSLLALVVWGGLVVLAVATWLLRRSGRL